MIAFLFYKRARCDNKQCGNNDVTMNNEKKDDKIDENHLAQVYREADLLWDKIAVQAAIQKMAKDVSQVLEDQNPLVICVMNGGLFLTSHLTLGLNFPLEIDYLHASRYRGETHGGSIKWLVKPERSFENRTVLVVDDILDEGYTLAAIIQFFESQNVKKVYTAVLVNKRHNRKAQPNWQPDFVGLEVEDRYVFGFGMDYKNYWRNVPGIYAVKEA